MLGFYWRLLQRQSRLPAIRLFALAVALACGVTFCITLLSDRVESLFAQQSHEVLGADLVLESSSLLLPVQKELLRGYSGEQAQTLVFQTMAVADGEFLLSSVKAVSQAYPLKGQLQVSDELYGTSEAVRAGPAIGQVWVEDRVLNSLELKVGDKLGLGEAEFEIAKVLVYEPDKGNNFYNFTPRVLMHLDDVPETNIVQLGSRVKYGFLLGEDPKQADALAQLKVLLEPTLEPNQKFQTIENSNESLAATLQKAYQFLTITSLIAVLLGAVGVALVSYQYAAEMTYQYAILRCLGLRGAALRMAVITPFMFFTLLAIGAGLLLGGGVHSIIVASLAEVLPQQLPAASWKPWLLSSLTALLVVLSFAWPFLRSLISTAPKILLMPKESRQQKLWPVICSVFIGMLILIYLNLQSGIFTLALVSGLALYLGLAVLIVLLSLWLLNRIGRLASPRFKLSLRLLNANKRMTGLQIIAVALTFFSLALIQTLRDDLISSWQAKVPEQAPNHFVINLFEQDLDSFESSVKAAGVKSSPLYPVVRGRLVGVNGVEIGPQLADNRQARGAVQRDLSLTWASDLPFGNKIVSGLWHSDAAAQIRKTDLPGVSVEVELAQSLSLQLGDVLSFVIETRELKAEVTSLRSLNWETFTPNFYMMFEERALADFPATYLTSFYAADEQKRNLPQLMQAFPNASFFDVDFLLKRIRAIINQVSFAVETILYFALFASLVVFIAIEMILHSSRLHSSAVLKALGANSALVQNFYRLQFILVGLLAGVLAYGLNIIASFITSYFVLDSQLVFNVKTLLLCLVITPGLVYLAGLYSINKVKRSPAKALLAQE